MSRINKPKASVERPRTHEGAVAYKVSPELELRRSVLATLLWEDTFYEDGVLISERISSLIPEVKPQKVYDLAIEAREKMKIRHTPLFIATEMLKYPTHRPLVAKLLENIIRRPDELTETLALYWREGRKPLASQLKKGLAKAFLKFDEYQFSKYDRDTEIKLRDVMFLVHPKPRDEKQAELFKKIIERRLTPPDTWEVNLSTQGNKAEVWERLLKENRLGSLALLRNLRNMINTGVNTELIRNSIENMAVEKILPFQFITAARHAPRFEPELENAMFKCVSMFEKLPGKTVLLIDGSGSMTDPLSSRSEAKRFDVACGLAILLREICNDVGIVVFSNNAYEVPPRRGFALRDAIKSKAEFQGTYTQNGIDLAAKIGYDRLIIITDKQSHQTIHNPLKGTLAYVVNVASYKNGIGYGEFVHVDGWSEYNSTI